MKHFLIVFLFLLNTCAPAYAQSAGRVISADAIDGVYAPANLIRNGNFTRNKDAWAGYSGSGAVPTTSSGGVAGSDPAISRVTDTAFNSSNTAGAIVKTAANKQGSGVYYGFVVPSKYQGRTVSISFDYRLASGTFVNGNPSDLTSAGDSSLTVWIKDASNSQITQPSNYRILNASTTSVGKFKATFQFSGVAYDMALLFHQARSETTAFDFRISNVVISEEIAPTGAVMTDPVQYTPIFGAGYGTVTNQKIYWTQSGKFMRVFGTATLGAAGVGTGEISLPSGRSVDVNFYQASAKNLVGGIRVIINTGGSGAGGTTQRLGFDGTTLDKVWLTSSSAQDAAGGTFVKTSVNSALSTSDTINIDFTVPILGWSSNVQLSSDAGNSLVDFSGYINSSFTATGGTTNFTLTARKDSTGAWNGTQFEVKSPGDYKVSAAAGPSTAANIQILVYVNGANPRVIGQAAGGAYGVGSTLLENLKAGDLISFRSLTTLSFVADAQSSFSIFKISNPQTIAASDTVAISYKSTAGGAIGTTYTRQSFSTKLQDTHGAWDGTTFRAPAPGLYRIASNVRSGNMTLGATQSFENAVYKNGSIYMLLNSIIGNGGANNWYTSGGSIDVPLLFGETLEIYTKANVAANQVTDPNSNFVSITRVGN